MNTPTSVISHVNSLLPQALSQFVAQLFKFNLNSPQARSLDALKGLNAGLRTGLKNLNDSANKANAQHGVGHVHLIGSGPGDAELLTVKAYRLLQSVDVVMYDWLVNPDILDMIPAHVERRFVGKKCGEHSMTQTQISELLVSVAKEGKTIARLKGGDPAIFARAAEECDLLTKHQIPFSIVPGITAASGASAYAGIPLTHRDCAQSVRFITAHLKDPALQPDWQSLVNGAMPDAKGKNAETLVFYMGLRRVESIMQQLQSHGLPVDLPVAIIDKATSAQQQVCIGQVKNIAQRLVCRQFTGPALIIVGEVVSKRQRVVSYHQQDGLQCQTHNEINDALAQSL
ncbi:uroporphyrinogen-III C-methyltransferase [Paraglaciecola sp. T6c]|uniref:uroporphyrinogen-III C-methyltransferase n=1 Tax=Pseudoalteromonas atlantica (strain T6c / ATCC BAA-1087) TaxID=3042615 RepID=UPI00005C7105|nr:uroporphyrinogen-III C-methyltransferase [Paraglaciecola sp. T6c]ABG41047.1 uroporphyrinogen-III C-methyltransferase [Paraglaciecola sp. T6c]